MRPSQKSACVIYSASFCKLRVILTIVYSRIWPSILIVQCSLLGPELGRLLNRVRVLTDLQFKLPVASIGLNLSLLLANNFVVNCPRCI
ncbi:hypothetical protein V1522DRAFT_399640 [Lipomyces starkeyi]